MGASARGTVASGSSQEPAALNAGGTAAGTGRLGLAGALAHVEQQSEPCRRSLWAPPQQS